MVYGVYGTDTFNREFNNLNKSEQEIVNKIFLQLKNNPYVGDQIRYRFFREKRIKEKRIYYLVYDDLMAVLVVAIGGKKAQQETIDRIVESFDYYKEYMKRILGKN